jgi:two-component system, NtrC family, response regulator PilR
VSRILVVDDEPSMRELLSIMLRKEGYGVEVAESRAAAAVALARGPVDMVITDLRLPDGDGMEILRHVKTASPETIVIVMTAYGSTQTAVAALKLGAHDYLIKPFDLDELRIVVRNAVERDHLQRENVRLKAELRERHGLERLVGASPAMAAVMDMLRSISGTTATVFITGESGTGKELVARAVHAISPRRDAPFVSINCGALPETLLESELFGHVKGAFTDAHQHKKGLFEVAHRGTLFLDEVGEMPQTMQVKLLRALQDKHIRRVGGTDEVEVDVRVIAATNRAVETLLSDGRMRQDLYYRLNVIHIHLPPLRERREDIPVLAHQFLERFSREMGKAVREISPQALEIMERHRWPGNVRELENVIERAVALETTSSIQAERLPPTLSGGEASSTVSVALGNGFSLDEHVRSIEADLVRRALEASRGSRGGAAGLLGITPRSLRYLMKKHGGSAAGRTDNY